MNSTDSLKMLYASLRDNVALAETLEAKMSPPLLVAPQTKWFESEERILVVGQETLGWKKGKLGINTFSDFKKIPDSVVGLQNAYIDFCFSSNSKRNRNSPFWRAYRKIRAAFDSNIYGIETNVLWTNLYRCSNDGKSWLGRNDKGERRLVEQAFDGLLLREIEILAPTGVVFFTGPRYDGYLKASLNGEYATLPVDDSYTTRELAKVCINKRSILAYRTYHPNYLQRAKGGKYRDVIDIIIRELSNVEGKDSY
jgi:hypothetical protein